VTAGAGLLAVFGHPDDEVAHAGGTLARYAAEGARVVVVTATRGELGEIARPELDTPENRARLGDLRMDELERALAHLAVTGGRWLGYRDSGMAGSPSNDDADAFCRCDLDEAVGRLVRVMRETRPDVVLTHNEAGGDGHPDHVRAALVTRQAFDRAGDAAAYRDQLDAPDGLSPWTPVKLYEAVDQFDRREKLRRLLAEQGILGTVPIALRAAARWRPAHERERAHSAALQGAGTVRIDVRPWLEARHAALLEFRSQLGPNDELIAMSPEDRRRVMPTEDFNRRVTRVTVPDIEDDLLAGLPVSG
jgi:LmbE family N-acetylglucosaminyl deacetylase